MRISSLVLLCAKQNSDVVIGNVGNIRMKTLKLDNQAHHLQALQVRQERRMGSEWMELEGVKV